MSSYSTLADDFYINMNLNTEMALPAGRDTTLSFFERVRKQYSTMRNFYTRDNGDHVLEEDKDQGHQRWLTLEPRRERRMTAGNPTTPFEMSWVTAK